MDNKVNTYVTSLKELLNRDNTKLPLTIPDYQRPYTWKAKNVIQLLDDVVRFSKFPEYRIGTIILHDNGTTLDIVDGQQRIITSLLITRHLTESQRKGLTSIDIPEHQRTIENVVNNNKVIGEYFERNPHSKEIIEDYFLTNCTVQVLELANLDEAFQPFDSSNNEASMPGVIPGVNASSDILGNYKYRVGIYQLGGGGDGTSSLDSLSELENLLTQSIRPDRSIIIVSRKESIST